MSWSEDGVHASEAKPLPEQTSAFLQGSPNPQFGGSGSDALALLMSDEAVPRWIDLQNRMDQLKKIELSAPDMSETLGALEKIISHYDLPDRARVCQDMEPVWASLPPTYYEFIPQRSAAWSAVRSRHLFTGSSAFSLLLCGTGPPSEMFGTAAMVNLKPWIPNYRRRVSPTDLSMHCTHSNTCVSSSADALSIATRGRPRP
jgi:hypothetical protein